MAGKIFMSYRRDDDPGFAHALFGRLEGEFGTDSVFMDVDMDAGIDFVTMLENKVAESDVLLAIIGNDWIDAEDDDGNRRLEKADDFVRIEIASALKLGKRVIPVLVSDADMPRADELPQSLKPLARRNAVAIRPVRFKSDSQGLITAVRDALMDVETGRAAATEAERQAAAEARRRTEAEAEKRAARLEREAAAQRLAGLSAEDIKKAEELANWDFIKASATTDDFRDHLARFTGGPTERYARARLERLVWADPAAKASIDALTTFIGEFPKGENVDAARQALAALEADAEAARQAEARRRQETEEWGKVAASTDKAGIAAFLAKWPKGQHANAAKARQKELRGGAFTRRGVLQGVGIGIGSSALAYLTFVPGELIWRQINDASIRTFTGHASAIFSVAFSPDGHFALSGSSDKTLKLWDVQTGQSGRTFAGHTRAVTSVAFSSDGGFALSGSDDATLKLWDVQTGQSLRTFTGHTNAVFSVAFSADGRFALSGSGDTLKFWDVQTGQALRTFTGHEAAVLSVSFSRDVRLALSGGVDKTLELWDVQTGQALRTFTGHTGDVFSVTFSPDGRFALSGSADNTLKLWDVSTGQTLRTFTGHTGDVSSVTFSPDGRFALSASADNTLKLWDVSTGQTLRTFTGHTGGVTSVAFSTDGRFALSGSWDNTLKLWDVSEWTQAP